MTFMLINDKGATLVEALAFTVVALIFVVSAIAIYSMVVDSSDAAAIGSQLSSMQTDINSLFQRQATYTDLSTGGAELVIDAEAVPENLNIRNGTTIRHPYGNGTVTFDSHQGLGEGINTQPEGDGASNMRFSITYTSLPKELCIQVLSRVSSQFNQVALLKSDGTTIGSIDEYGNAIGNFSDSNGLPLDIEEAEAECVDNAQLRYYSN